MIIFVLASVCSWEDSQTVRNFLSTSFTSLLSRHHLKSFNLAQDCPLVISEREDLLYPYYSLKTKQSISTFECSDCKKQFKSEQAIEEHIVNTHVHSSGKCLADLCYFLPCGRDDEVIKNRCEDVMAKCFGEEVIGDAVELCRYREESIWDSEIDKAGYMILYVIVAVVCCIYYIVLWAELEEQKLSGKNINKKRKKY